MGWINEAQGSLLMTGSDDGVVRVRDGLLQAGATGPDDMEPPRLLTALHVAPVRRHTTYSAAALCSLVEMYVV